jgi:iron complex transport system permease protein
VCLAEEEIIWDARLPAIVLALIVGVALAFAGGTLQGTFRNPLADPYLLGISSGATLGAATIFVFGIGAAAANLYVPLAAFLGALATSAVILFAARSRRSTTESLVLTGVVLTSLLSAVLLVILLYNSPLVNLQVTYWLLGGLSGATWGRDGIVFAGVLVGGAFLLLYARQLNLLQLGPDVTQSLGLDPRAARTRFVLLASIITAVTVAFTGIIGFVGLVAPHVARRLVGSDYRLVLPVAAGIGAIFLLLAYDLSVVVIPGVELPVGIFTAFAGAPFFLYLLYRRREPRARGVAA